MSTAYRHAGKPGTTAFLASATGQSEFKVRHHSLLRLDGLLPSTGGSIQRIRVSLGRISCASWQCRTRSNAIGVKEVRKWAETLPRGSSVIDLGCGPGFPITVVLVEERLQVFAVDAAHRLFWHSNAICPATNSLRIRSRVEFFDRTFDAVLSIGLMFLLKAEEQRRLIRSFADILVPGGRLLFTSTARPHVWTDGMTGLESISLGAEEYGSCSQPLAYRSRRIRGCRRKPLFRRVQGK